ncbi:hypothetical protein J2S94_002948 [Arthrobacter bambusae]|nr:hypothetical protein [Arthrobacter bambusae]
MWRVLPNRNGADRGAPRRPRMRRTSAVQSGTSAVWLKTHGLDHATTSRLRTCNSFFSRLVLGRDCGLHAPRGRRPSGPGSLTGAPRPSALFERHRRRVGRSPQRHGPAEWGTVRRENPGQRPGRRRRTRSTQRATADAGGDASPTIWARPQEAERSRAAVDHQAAERFPLASSPRSSTGISVCSAPADATGEHAVLKLPSLWIPLAFKAKSSNKTPAGGMAFTAFARFSFSTQNTAYAV